MVCCVIVEDYCFGVDYMEVVVVVVEIEYVVYCVFGIGE